MIMRKLYTTILFFFATLAYGQLNIVSVNTVDSDLNGHIDQIRIFHDDDVNGASLPADGSGITIAGYSIEGVTYSAETSNLVIVSLTELLGFDTGNTPNVAISAGTYASTAAQAVAAYSDPASDGAPPFIMGVYTIDGDQNGYLDGVRVQFSENINDNVSGNFAANCVVNGYSNVSQDTGETADDDDIILAFDENEFPDTDNAPAFILFGSIAVDFNNIFRTNQQVFTNTTDNAGPAIVYAATGDSNSDGYIDRIIVTLSESFDGTVGVSDFSVDGYTITEAGSGGGAILELQVVPSDVSLAPDTDVTPTVLLNPDAIDDLVSPPNSIDLQQFYTGTVDEADPVIVSLEIYDTSNPLDGLIDEMQITWSEAVSTADMVAPTWDDFGVITLPNGNALSTGTVSATGDPEVFSISGISDQVLPNTSIGQSNIQNFPIGNWVDQAGNVNTGNVLSPLVLEDRAAPVITEFRYEDGNGDGRVDGVRVFFSEPLDETTTFSPANFSFSQVGDFIDVGFGGSSVALTVGDGLGEVLIPLGNHSAPVDTESVGLQIVVQTALTTFSLVDDYTPPNTNIALGSQTQASYTDGANPILETAVTGDADSDGEIDQVVLTFSEIISQNSVDGNSTAGVTDDFSVDGYEISSVNTLNGVDSEDVVITLIESGAADTEQVPAVTILVGNGLLDLSENPVTDNGAGVTTEDGASPVIYSSTMHQSNAYLEVVFSEPIFRSPVEAIVAGDFTISTSTQAGITFNNNPMQILNLNGAPMGSTGEGLLVQFDLTSIPDYDNYLNTIELITDQTSFVDNNSVSISSAESTGAVQVNDLTPPPSITSASWETTDPSPASFSGYIEIVFTEDVIRGFEASGSNYPIRLTDTDADGNLIVATYSAGTSSNCSTKELCVAYDDGGSTITIGSDDNTDIQLLDNSGTVVSDSYTISTSTFRLQLNDISGPFTGVETYTFSLRSGVSMRGATSGNYAPFNYEYTFNLPDLVPAQFENATFQDIDNNGIADQVVVTLAGGENFDGNTVQASEFSMGAFQVATLIADGFPDDGSITLNLDDLGLDGTEDLALTYTPDDGDGTVLLDSDGNEIATHEFSLIQVIDEVAPAIYSATTRDTDQNGLIDRMEIVFTENILDASLENDYSDFVTQGLAYPILGYETGAADDDALVLVLQERTDLDSDTDLTPNIFLLDNEVADSDVNALMSNQIFSEVIDGAGPAIISAVTDDSDGNGFIDQILVTFSENIDFFSVDTDGLDFNLPNPYSIASVTENDDNSVILHLNELGGTDYDTDATPDVVLLGSTIQDLTVSPNTLSTAQNFTATEDGAAPAIVSVTYLDNAPGQIPDGRIGAMELAFSETVGAGSQLSANDLGFTQISDFVGASFGDNADDLIAASTESVVVPLGAQATNLITAETTPGVLQINTKSSFSLVDDILPAAVNTNSELKIQSQATVFDGAGPMIVDFRYVDGTTPGVIDEFYLTFSEPLDWDNSFLSQSNLNLSNDGNLGGASFGNSTADILVTADAGNPNATSTAVLLGDAPENTTVATGLEISLQNPGGTPFNFRDAANNNITEFELAGGGLTQSQALYTDDADPIIYHARTAESSPNGRISDIDLFFSEPFDGNTAITDGSQLTVSAYTIESISSFPTIGRILVNLVEGPSPNSGETPGVNVVAASILDLSGNILAITSSPIVPSDEVRPVIISAVTVDSDLDGHLDALDITFSEPVNDGTIASGDFTMPDYTILGVDSDPQGTGLASVNDDLIRLSIQELIAFDTEVTPNVNITGGIADLAGRTRSSQAFTGTTDGAPPVIASATTQDLNQNGHIDRLAITFSENISGPSLGASGDFIIGSGYGYSNATFNGSNGVTLLLNERVAYDTEVTPDIQLVANEILDLESVSTALPLNFTNTLDGAAPAIIGLEYKDNAGGYPDGQIDQIELTFSENLGGTSFLSNANLGFNNVSDFGPASFGGSTANQIAAGSNVATFDLAVVAENLITHETIPGTLEIETLGTFNLDDQATPSNSYTTAELQTHTVVGDGASPVITAFSYTDATTPGIIDEFHLTFSEPLDWSNSFLSQNNLELSNVGNLTGASFGEGELDALSGAAAGDAYTAATPILLNNPIMETTFAEGLQIALQNPAGDPTFGFSDGAGNVTNEATLTPPRLLQSQAFYRDDAAPFIHSTFTRDSDSDGKIDRLELLLTEEVGLNDIDATPSASGDTDQLDVDGYNISFVTTASASDDDTILINVDEGMDPDSDNTPNVSVLAATILDLSGANALVATGASPIVSQDRVGPVIIAAVTVDENGDGHIDGLEITFDDNILDSSLDGATFSDFVVDGYDIDGYNTGNTANDLFLRLSLVASASFDTDATPSVSLIANEVGDLQGNTILGGNQIFHGTTDGASPVILLVEVDDNQINASEKPIFSLQASEPVEARLDISNVVDGKTQENMPISNPAENPNGSHSYTYTPGENGSLMNHVPSGVAVEFTIDDGFNTPDTDNSITVSVDNRIPTITITSQEVGDSGDETIEGTISAQGDTDLDNLLVELSIEGSGFAAATNNGSGSGTWQFSTNQGNGVYDIDAQVTDPFGNASTNVPDSDVELQIGGVMVIPAPALNVVCIDGNQVQVGDIDIQETKENDFKIGQNRTLFLQLPEGVQFDVSLVPQEADMSPDIGSIAFDYLGTQTLRITMDIDGESQLDILRIQGIELRAVGSPGVVNMDFLSGTASIFGLQNGASAVSVTVVAPPDAPVIFTEDDLGSPISEVAVALGVETFTFETEASGNTYNWYDYTGALIHNGSSATTADLSVNTGSQGFDVNSAGLYSFFVGEENDQGCESEWSKVNVYIYDREVDPETFTFVETDAVGSVLSMRHDAANFEGSFLGPGLGAIDVASDPATAQFIPSIIGQGLFEITFQVTNRATLESYDFKTTYSVISGGSIFSNGDEVAAAYCNSEDAFVMNANVDDIPEAGPISPVELFFYGLRIRERGTNIIVENVLLPPAGWTSDYGEGTPQADKPFEGWRINPAQAPVGNYTIDRLIVPAGSTDFAADLQVYNSIDIDINATPTAVLSSPKAYICEDDDPIFLQAILNGSLSVTVLSYQVTDLTNGNGSEVIVGRVFDPTNPLGLSTAGIGNYPVGIYQVDYLSSPDDDTNGCTGVAESLSIEVLEKSAQTLLSLQENMIIGHGELENGAYVFEYCEGDEFDDLSIELSENEHIEWYTNVSLTNPLEIELGSHDGSFVSAIDLLGYRTVLGGEDEDFYYVLVTENNLEGGCQADPVEVRFVGREIPEIPVVDLGSSVSGGLVNGNLVQFNYCTSTEATLEPLELQALEGEESYYLLSYEENSTVQTFSGITSLSINLNDYRIMDLSPGAHYEFQLVRITDDNSFVVPGSEFPGCASEGVLILINVHGIPNIPIQSQFSDGPNELDGRVVYYMCQGESLPDISINPPAGVNEYVYQWYEDVLETTPMSVLDNQGDRVTEQDMQNATFQFDRNTPGIYTMYVKINSNVREDAFFQGCPSGLTQVDVIVSSIAQDPAISTESGAVISSGSGFSSAFNFCVNAGTGMPTGIAFTADAGTDQNLVRWYLADEFASDLASANPVAFGNQVTAGDLGISGVENGTFYFGVTHNTGIVNPNDSFEGFDGCLSNTVFFSVNINTIPGASFSFSGITEGEGTTFSFYDPNATTIASDDGLIFEIHNEAGDLVATHTADNLAPFIYPFDSEGIYSATLRINSTTDCDSTLTRKFRILEKVVTNTISYNQDFDSGDGGWFVEFQGDNGLYGSIDDPARASSWVHGEPNGTVINESAGGGGSVWSTTGSAGNRYLGGERSYVYSPAFDISRLTNPTIRLKTIRDFDTKDGVVLQYSTDDGSTWVTLGDYSPGQNPPSTGQYWYTENGISSAPGSITIGSGTGFNPQRVGWASKLSSVEVQELENANGWANSTHSLASIPEKSNVRFRIALASSGASSDEKNGDGFGFDELQLFSQTRTVLIEQFSSSLSDNSIIVNNQIAGMVDTDQITYINYFTDLGNGRGRGLDVINGRNAEDPGARAAFYGVSDIPRSVIDGDLFEVSLNEGTNQEILDEPSFNANDINIKSLEPPLFTIENVLTSYNSEQGILSMSASFIPQYAENAVDLSFYFGLAETVEIGTLDHQGNVIESIGGYSAGDRIVNALRVLLPDATGFNHVGNVVPNASDFEYSVDWFVDNLYDANNLRLAVFVQNNETKKVLQSMSEPVLGVSETVTGVKDGQFDKVYPNPANQNVTISFAAPLLTDSEWNLVDASGKVVSDGFLLKGSNLLHLKTEKISSGVYFVTLFNEENSRKVARIIIEH